MGNEKVLTRIAIYRCNSSSKYKYLMLWDTTLEYNAAVVLDWKETVGPNNVHLLIDKMRATRQLKLIDDPNPNDVFDNFVRTNGNAVFIKREK